MRKRLENFYEEIAQQFEQRGAEVIRSPFCRLENEFAQSGKYSEFQRIIFIHKRVKSSKDIAHKDRKIFPSYPNAITGRQELNPSARIMFLSYGNLSGKD